VTSGAGPSAEAEVAFGIDIGGTKVLGIALGPLDTIVAEARVPTPAAGAGAGAGAGVVQAIADVVSQLDAAVGTSRTSGTSGGTGTSRTSGTSGGTGTSSTSGGAGDADNSGNPDSDAPAVGVGAPGMLDREGRLRFAPNLPQAHGVNWRVLIGERLPARRVVVENDANLAVLAEHGLGAAQGYGHVVMVTLGTGIGGGLIVDGRVQVGGHMVVDPAGPPCPCGRRGCWERFASGGGLGLMAREAALAGRLPGVVALAGGDPEGVRGEDVSAAALAGDPDARRVIEQVGWWVGFGLANLACVLDPECFVLGGGLVGAGDLLLDATRRAFDELVEGGATRPATAIVTAAFGERSGAVGAALAARDGGLG
jgi:glucokinase